MSWIEAILLGVTQGLTEFLPVSSSGHLMLIQHLFHPGGVSKAFENRVLFVTTMLHVGTLAAILVYYRRAVWEGARGLLGSAEVAPEYDRASVIRAGLLTAVATLPAVVVGLTLKPQVEEAFGSARTLGVDFLFTALTLVLTLRLRRGERGPKETCWRDALAIGLAQAIAILPGVSRSGMTLASSLALGLAPAWAVGFSLMMAVVAIAGGAVLELKDLDPTVITGDLAGKVLVASLVAGLVGFGAIVWLVRLVRTGRLWYFSVYLIVLGAIVLIGLAIPRTEGPTDGRRATSVDRPLRGGAAGTRHPISAD